MVCQNDLVVLQADDTRFFSIANDMNFSTNVSNEDSS